MDLSSKPPAYSADNRVRHLFHALEKGAGRLETVNIPGQSTVLEVR